MNGNISADDILDKYIPQYESMGGQNIPNYKFDPKKFSAQGPWQITTTNWLKYGPEVGIDTDAFPTAMTAPKGEQRKVAEYLLNYTPQGIRNWTDFNPKLKAALDQAGYNMPQEQEQDPSKMSDADLLKSLQQDYPGLQFQMPQPKPPATTTKTGGPKVDAPYKSELQKWGESPEPQDSARGKWVMPGLKHLAKAVSAPDSTTAASELMEGFGNLMIPAAMGVGLGEVAGAASIPEAIGSLLGLGGKAVKSAAVGGGLAGAANVGSRLAKADPETTRFLTDLGGWIGGLAGPNIKMPGGSGIAPALIQMAGHIHPSLRIPAEIMSDIMFAKGGGSQGPKGAAPKDTGKSPTDAGIKVNLAELNKMHENGIVNDDRYVAIRNGAPPTSEEILANRRAELAKEAKERADEASKGEKGSPIQLVPKVDWTGTGPQVNVGGVKVTPPPQVTPVPVANPTGAQGLQPSAPVAPPPPGSMGTAVGPQPPNVPAGTLGRPLFGPPQTSTNPLPVEPPPTIPQNITSVGPQPPNAPPSAAVGPIPTGTIDVPQEPQTSGIGQVNDPFKAPSVPMAPRANLQGRPPQGSTGLGRQLPSLEDVAIRIADEAKKKDTPPPKAKGEGTRSRAAKKIGLSFTPTAEEFLRAREIYDDRERAKLPTASFPS